MHLATDSLIGLLACMLFFLATLTLCSSKRRYQLFSAPLIFFVLATVLLDNYAFSIVGEMQTAMQSMQMMTAATIVQNIVLSLYLLVCTALLWREPRLITRWLGWVIITYLATQLLPATWFSLQFLVSALG